MAIARGALAFHMARFYVPSSSANDIIWREEKRYATAKSPPILRSREEKENTTLSETDFEEKFIRGSGPGGQKVNKTSNCVQLKHKETGVVVKCHESRSLEKNREIAREKLLDKLRVMFSPSESSIYKKIEDKKKREEQALRRRRMKEDAVRARVEM